MDRAGARGRGYSRCKAEAFRKTPVVTTPTYPPELGDWGGGTAANARSLHETLKRCYSCTPQNWGPSSLSHRNKPLRPERRQLGSLSAAQNLPRQESSEQGAEGDAAVGYGDVGVGEAGNLADDRDAVAREGRTPIRAAAIPAARTAG